MQNCDIVAELKDACGERQLPAPTLISESGRIASHQSVLIFDVLSTCDVPSGAPQPPQEESPQYLESLETYQSINVENYQETYHDVTQFKEEAISRLGICAHRASRVERIYWACCEKLIQSLASRVRPGLKTWKKSWLPSTVNLSVFQSAPDCWAMTSYFRSCRFIA